MRVRNAYPLLSATEVGEALGFYEAHRTEIDRFIRANLPTETLPTRVE